MGSAKKVAVLVAERGAEWSSWMRSLRDEADEVAVIAQRNGESASELATRVRARVEALEASSALVSAALVGAPVFDPSTLPSRSLVVRAITSHMVATGGGVLFLDAGGAPGKGRFAMEALASVVEDQLFATGVSVVTARGLAPLAARAA